MEAMIPYTVYRICYFCYKPFYSHGIAGSVRACAAMDKKQLRAHFLGIRAAIPRQEHHNFSAAICEHILGSPLWQLYEHIFLYWPIRSEADITALITPALRQQKKLYLPRIWQNGDMLPSLYIPEQGLIKGLFDIPIPSAAKYIQPKDIDMLCLMPLAAFDRHGTRLGYGGGYYDRFCAFYPHIYRCGISFAQQYSKQDLPRQEHDMLLQSCCTQQGMIEFA